MKKLFLIIGLFINFSLHAQTPATLFGEGLFTKGGVFGLTLSSKGDHMLWVNSKGGRDTLLIMESFKVAGKWQTPKLASFSPQPGVWKYIDPMFTPDNKTLLFQSNRPIGETPERKKMHIWAVDKTPTGWGEPYNLTNLNTDSSESYASMANNRNIYFTGNRKDYFGISDLYISKFENNKYQPPLNLGSDINTSDMENNPSISPDEDYIIFSSDRQKERYNGDLYISFKIANAWSKPLQLGPEINTGISEFCPFVHKKQSKIYFSRLDRSGGGFNENIYSAYINIKKLRRQALLAK
ncbi:MAG: hypothetical protein WKF35_06080 [Ferruginibacter sp.]